MLKKIKLSIAVVAFALAGCAPTSYLQGSKTENARITNATVVFENASMKVGYIYVKNAKDGGDKERAAATSSAAKLHALIQNGTTRQLAAALASRGILGGGLSDTKIILRPVGFRADVVDRNEVEVTVQTRGKPIWIAIVRAVDRNETSEVMSQRFTDAILSELKQAGFIAL